MMVRNPVMFVVEIGSVLTTLIWIRDLVAPSAGAASPAFTGQVALWLWFTVVFANFAEALAEGRGKAQAAALRGLRQETQARKVLSGREERVPASTLRKGDVVVAEAGDVIPGDGEVIEGIASVDESAMTGESAPVIRESGGDRSAVTGGTRVLSDRIVVRITVDPGQSFLDRMIGLVEGAKRQKTPNEIALTVLLAGMTIIFLIACVTLVPFGVYSGMRFSVTVIVALLVCLIPTTIGGLLSAIGIAGMDRLIRHNVIPTSGRAVEAAGDIDTILLDKTGTITLGNRMATRVRRRTRASRRGAGRRRPAREPRRRDARGPLDRRPREGALRSARTRAEGGGAHGRARCAGARGRSRGAAGAPPGAGRALRPVLRPDPDERLRHRRPSRAQGSRRRGREARRGARRADARRGRAGSSTGIAKSGGTPLVVSDGARVLGVVHLKDIVKGGLKERFVRFRSDGPAHGHDHRRQPADRRGDRGRGGRRRLPRRGDAGDEAEAHPRTSRPRASSSR